VREVRRELEALPGVEVIEAGPALNVVHLLEGADAAVIVDAVRSPGGRRVPGEIVRVEAGPDGLPADVATSVSSHGLGLAEAVGLAAALGRPPRIVFLGVEVADVAIGRPLSAAVAEALPLLVRQIRAETRAFAKTLGS
jgi:hydrogenase maturation protease